MWKKKRPEEISYSTMLNRRRKRPEILNVGVSEREKSEYIRRVYLTGRQKREYMMQSALTQSIIVNGNHHLYERIDERLSELTPIIEDIINGQHVDEPILEEIRTIYELTENWV